MPFLKLIISIVTLLLQLLYANLKITTSLECLQTSQIILKVICNVQSLK